MRNVFGSTLPFREQGAHHCRFFHRLLTRRALLYTEMVTAEAILHGKRNRLLGFTLALQVLGPLRARPQANAPRRHPDMRDVTDIGDHVGGLVAMVDLPTPDARRSRDGRWQMWHLARHRPVFRPLVPILFSRYSPQTAILRGGWS